MSQENQPPRPLSEISHLFLSELRAKPGDGVARTPPQRTPPASHSSRSDASENDDAAHASEMLQIDDAANQRRRVTAVIGHHLNGQLSKRVGQYARHLAGQGERIGLIWLDDSTLRLESIERSQNKDADPSDPTPFDVRSASDALRELDCDIDRWLLVMPASRSVLSRQLLELAEDWVLLATCDHDGVVSSYKTLKGMGEGKRPRLTLSLLDASNTEHADKIYAKLASVCRQFLDWQLDAESPVEEARHVASQIIMQSEVSSGIEHARVVQSFLESVCVDSTSAPAQEDVPEVDVIGIAKSENIIERVAAVAQQMKAAAPASIVTAPVEMPAPVASQTEPTCEPKFAVSPATPRMQVPIATPASFISAEPTMRITPATDDVIELPQDACGQQLITAAMSVCSSHLLTAINAPSCTAARVAVARDGTLTLIAAASSALANLPEIVKSHAWLAENRELLAMALPQIAVNRSAAVKLHLLLDHADRNAAMLSPLMSSGTVSVQIYRKLRWAGRTGMLLEAA